MKKIFRYSRLKVVLSMILCLVPLAGLAYQLNAMAIQKSSVHPFLLGLFLAIELVLGLILIFLLIRFIGNQTVLEIDEHGLIYRTGIFSLEQITWDEVESLHYRSGRFLKVFPFSKFYLKLKHQTVVSVSLIHVKEEIEDIEKSIQKFQSDWVIYR